MKEQKQEIVYAFIDSQNLNLGTGKDIFSHNGKRIHHGWKLDYNKFRKYLTDKFKVQKAFLFIGYIPTNKKLYDSLRRYGYELVHKPTVKDSNGKPKGNVDAELVLHAAKLEFDNYDLAVIVSGDGDFYCLHEHLENTAKLKNILIPNRKSESTLLRKFQKKKVFVDRERKKLEYVQK